jgi:hypothetical protein
MSQTRKVWSRSTSEKSGKANDGQEASDIRTTLIIPVKRCKNGIETDQLLENISRMNNMFEQNKNTSSPATRHGGAWGERKYSSCSLSTSALDGGEWSASRPRPRFYPRGKDPRYPLYRRLGGPESRSGHRG